MFFVDNPVGQVQEPVANHFGPNGMPSNFIQFRRPFLDERGIPCVLANTGQWTVEKGVKRPIHRKARVIDLINNGYRVPTFALNATSLRKEDWIELDRSIVMAAREPLAAAADLAAANTFGGFNGWGRSTLEYEAMSDPGAAYVDMDGLTEGTNDSPLFKLRSMPLPITHSDFSYDDRRLEISRNSGTPLDTVSAEAAARRVSETIEDTVIGVRTGLTYGTQSTGVTAHDGNSTVFGYTNFTPRVTKTNITTPTGANPNSTISDILAMIQSLKDKKHYGPFMAYFSSDWDEFLDNDYAFTNGSNWASDPSRTLRQRIAQIDKISGVKTLERLTGSFVILLVQMTSTVAEMVMGMDFRTLQWDTKAGMQHNFKVMTIQAPRLRSDYNDNTGIAHGTTA